MFARSFSAMCAIALVSSVDSANARNGYYNYEDEAPGGGFARRGTFLLGGSFGFAAIETTVSFQGEEAEVTNTSFNGSLLFGHFLADSFFLGGAVGINYQSEDQGSFEQSQTTGTIEVVPRYYVPLSDARAAFLLLQVNLGYVSGSVESSEDTEFELSGALVGVGAGIGAVLGDDDDGATVDLMLTLRHSFLTRDEDFGDEVDVGVTTVGVSLGIGTYF